MRLVGSVVTNSYLAPVSQPPSECVIADRHLFLSGKIMNKLWIPAAIASTLFSANVFADHRWDDGDHRGRHHRHRIERVMVQPMYEAPHVIYQAAPVAYAPPPVAYRERVVYRDRPVYYQEEPRVYSQPAPRYVERPAPYQYDNTNRFAGQAIGAVTGGLIGNQFGNGNGRVVSTAVGAVLGSIVGGNMAGY